MSKHKAPKAWVAYKIAKIGKRLGTSTITHEQMHNVRPRGRMCHGPNCIRGIIVSVPNETWFPSRPINGEFKMTAGLQVDVDLINTANMTLKVAGFGRTVDINIRLFDLIKDELDKCLKTETFIREMPLFESRKEEVAAYLDGQLEHCVRRKAALNCMSDEMLKAAANAQ